MNIHIYICIFICRYIYTYIYIYMYIHICIYTYLECVSIDKQRQRTCKDSRQHRMTKCLYSSDLIVNPLSYCRVPHYEYIASFTRFAPVGTRVCWFQFSSEFFRLTPSSDSSFENLGWITLCDLHSLSTACTCVIWGGYN